MTAMQQMIEWLMEQDELLMNKTRMILVAKADSLLQEEKEQICDAYEDGKYYGSGLGEVNKINQTGEIYYQEQFKQ